MERFRFAGLAAFLAMVGGAAVGGAGSLGAQEVQFELTIRDHRFEPAELAVPAGQRLIITVHNSDASPEEFESGALGVEKVVSAGRQVVVRIGPLAAGRYEFISEFHRETARGALVVVP